MPDNNDQTPTLVPDSFAVYTAKEPNHKPPRLELLLEFPHTIIPPIAFNPRMARRIIQAFEQALTAIAKEANLN